MIRHGVLIKWKDETDPDQVDAAASALAEMPALMPFIRRYDTGRDLGVTGSHDFAIVATSTRSRTTRPTPITPNHKAATAAFIAAILESMSRVQFTV